MSLKRKELKVHNIAKIYVLTLLKQNRHPYITNKEPLSSFHNAVELAYASLNSPQKAIINNDFFYQAYPGWWRNIYKKNNYQKLKIEAINRFLEVFYEIEE